MSECSNDMYNRIEVALTLLRMEMDNLRLTIETKPETTNVATQTDTTGAVIVSTKVLVETGCSCDFIT